MNEFFVQGYVRSFADLRDRKLVVDDAEHGVRDPGEENPSQARLKDGADYTVVPVGRGELRLKPWPRTATTPPRLLNLR